MKRTKLVGKSNWATVAFLLINKILGGEDRVFSRPQLMSTENLHAAVIFLMLLGHKEKPTRPDASLQKTIQILRDQGYIEFRGQGEYKLTEMGYRKMLDVIKRHQKIINKLNRDLREDLTV